MPGIALDGSEDLPSYEESQPTKEATPMKDQMQYIVIEGRKPQDGAKPAQALLILPEWISPTLACAGIVGRVIELTDGNVIEQGAVFMGEQEMLDSLRIDIRQDSESQQEEVSPTAIDPNAVQPADDHVKECPLCALQEPEHSLGCPNKAAASANALDNAYREGNQAMRDSINNTMHGLGMPEGAKPGQWMKARLEELAETKALLATTQACLEAVEEPASVSEIAPALNRLLLDFGGTPGGEYLEFLRTELEELAQFRKDRPETLARLQAAEDIVAEVRNAKIPVDNNERIAQLELIANNALRDMNNSNDEVCKLLTANEHMREELRNMHAQLLERPTVMNFAGPVTIVQGNPPSVFGPDLGKSAE